MSDVLAIAMRRREKLQAEIGKIEKFLRLAIELSEMESIETSRGVPAQDLPNERVEPGSSRELADGPAEKPETATRSGLRGRGSLFRGAFGAHDDLPKVVNH